MIQGNLHTIHTVACNIEHESSSMVNVARKTHEDSVRVKSLTRVATIYLPATLIAVSFPPGSNRPESFLIDSLHSDDFQLRPCAAGTFWQQRGKAKDSFCDCFGVLVIYRGYRDSNHPDVYHHPHVGQKTGAAPMVRDQLR